MSEDVEWEREGKGDDGLRGDIIGPLGEKAKSKESCSCAVPTTKVSPSNSGLPWAYRGSPI